MEEEGGRQTVASIQRDFAIEPPNEAAVAVTLTAPQMADALKYNRIKLASAAPDLLRTLRDLPIRRKLLVILMAVTTAALATAGLGILMADSHSYFNQNPLWTPSKANAQGRFGLTEFVKTALS